MLALVLLLQPTGALDVALGIDHTTRTIADVRSQAFELGRAELGGRLRWPGIEAEVRLETARSAQPQSLLGVDGNSLIVRARRVRVAVTHAFGPLAVAAEAGLVGDPILEALERGDDLRDLSPLAAQVGGLLDAADAGARLRLAGFDERVALEVGFANGEGATEVEQNDGVDTTLVAAGVPWRGDALGGPAEVRLVAAWRDGSRGAGAVQDDRLAAGLTVRGEPGSLGVAFVRADGFGGRAERVVTDLEIWANATLLPGWGGVLAGFEQGELDADAPDASQQRILAGLYLDPALPGAPTERLRLYATWSRTRFGADAAPILPTAVDEDRVFLRLALTGTLEVTP